MSTTHNNMTAIDYVVAMVFPDDPEWLRVLQDVVGPDYDALGAIDNVRYRSWGTEELLVRCVRKFMPWVRDIHIVLAQESQKQPWMDQYGVKAVYHHDIIPEQFLPTYNSRTIEMFLHNIPGLSEHFIYGNDDMFPLSPLEPTDFFQEGKPCQKYKEQPFPDPPSLFHQACLNGLNFVAKDYGRHFDKTWLKNGHGIVPLLKQTCIGLWKRHPREMEASITPFRDVRNYNQYIYGWEQHLAGNYVRHAPRRHLVTLRDGRVQDIRDIIAIPNCGVVCVNDHENVRDVTPYAKAAREAITIKLRQP